MWVKFLLDKDKNFYPGQTCYAEPYNSKNGLYKLTANGITDVFTKSSFEKIGDTDVEKELYLLDIRMKLAKVIDLSEVIVVRMENGTPFSWSFVKNGKLDTTIDVTNDKPDYFVQKNLPFVLEYAKDMNKQIMYFYVDRHWTSPNGQYYSFSIDGVNYCACGKEDFERYLYLLSEIFKYQ